MYRLAILAPALLGVFAFARPVLAQDPTLHSCDYIAPQWEQRNFELWPDSTWQEDPENVTFSTDSVAIRLAGSYRLVRVQTEGFPGRQVTLWRLRLAPPPQDSVLWYWSHFRGVQLGAVALPLIGSLDSVSSVNLPDTAQLVFAESAPTSVQLTLIPRTQTLTLDVNPGIDAGTFYSIFAIDSAGGFRGRWSDGSQLIYDVPAPYAAIAEHPRGLFCAWRVP